MDPAEFELVVPATPSSLFYVRLFAGAVARAVRPGGSASERWIEELKLLLTEAASFALDGTDDTVTVGFDSFDDRLRCRIHPVASFEASGLVPDPFDLVVTLAPDARIDGGQLVMSVPVA